MPPETERRHTRVVELARPAVARDAACLPTGLNLENSESSGILANGKGERKIGPLSHCYEEMFAISVGARRQDLNLRPPRPYNAGCHPSHCM